MNENSFVDVSKTIQFQSIIAVHAKNSINSFRQCVFFIVAFSSLFLWFFCLFFVYFFNALVSFTYKSVFLWKIDKKD